MLLLVCSGDRNIRGKVKGKIERDGRGRGGVLRSVHGVRACVGL